MSGCLVIVNPKAGNGRAMRLLPGVQAILQAAGFIPQVLETRGPGDATAIARRASEGSLVVSVGGDGTLNEVVNGLPQSCVLATVPGGSGNDLMKSLPLPGQPLEALRHALGKTATPIDAGVITCQALDGSGNPTTQTEGRVFLNGVGVGFDAAVAVRKASIPVLTGTAVYATSVLLTLGKYKAPMFSINADGQSLEARKLLIAIGNGKCAGGGFFLTPAADVRDGKLDVCLIDDVGIGTIMRLMPKVMKGGHLQQKCVSYTQTDKVELRAAEPFHVHADGEIVGRNVNVVSVGIRPGYVRLLGA